MSRIHLPFLFISAALLVHPNAIANDECADAVVLVVGTGCTFTSGSWTDATQSLAPIACSGSTSLLANDAWFTFTAIGEHSILSVQSDGDNDAVVEVFNGGCGSLTSIACADATLLGGIETLTLNTVPGSVYYVRTYWWDYGSTPASLVFGICVEEGVPSPVNDECGSVTPTEIPTGSSLTFTGTTEGADTIGDHVMGSIMAAGNASVWHAFSTTECASVRISYCGTLPPFSDTWSLLAMTCPADSVVFADALDLSACGNGNVTLSFDSLPAGIWYLPVLSDASTAWGSYEVIVAVNPCVTGLADPRDPDGWSAAIEGDRIIVVPGSSGTWIMDILGTDGRLHRQYRVTGTAGEPVMLPIDRDVPAICVARISTLAGRKTLRLARPIP
jgi:hypothetical protein